MCPIWLRCEGISIRRCSMSVFLWRLSALASSPRFWRADWKCEGCEWQIYYNLLLLCFFSSFYSFIIWYHCMRCSQSFHREVIQCNVIYTFVESSCSAQLGKDPWFEPMHAGRFLLQHGAQTVELEWYALHEKKCATSTGPRLTMHEWNFWRRIYIQWRCWNHFFQLWTEQLSSAEGEEHFPLDLVVKGAQ